MRPTQRILTDVETKQAFRLYSDQDQNWKLMTDKETATFEYPIGTEVNGWYATNLHNVSIKINALKTIHLKRGEFYNLKLGEEITHRKVIGFDKRFKKVY